MSFLKKKENEQNEKETKLEEKQTKKESKETDKSNKKENNKTSKKKSKENSFVSNIINNCVEKVFDVKMKLFMRIKANTPVIIIGNDVLNKYITILKLNGIDITTASIQRIPYKVKTLDGDFFEKMEEILTKYYQDNKSEQNPIIYAVFPNECFSIDLINVPIVSKKRMAASLKVKLESSYKNIKDLEIRNQIIFSSKQFSSYEVVATRKNLLTSHYAASAKSNMPIKKATYAANATLCSVFRLAPKNKNHSFMFVDIKKDNTYISFCYKGKTIGYYSLQYGYKVLESTKIVYENMLSNHDLAEITVLNAIEKAKSKQLTVFAETEENTEEKEESFGRKAPKKLPKFLQRPIPETDEDLVYENFRIFMKWALLLNSDYKKSSKGLVFDYILFNFPEKFKYVITKANNEMVEDRIEFRYFELDHNVPIDVKENLELYGAIFMSHYNKNQNF